MELTTIKKDGAAVIRIAGRIDTATAPELEQAIGWYRRALEADELREDVHRAIMRCYARAGRPAEALFQYRFCREVLRRELGIEPSAETIELYRQITGEEVD